MIRTDATTCRTSSRSRSIPPSTFSSMSATSSRRGNCAARRPSAIPAAAASTWRASRIGSAASVAAIYPTGGAIGKLLQRLVEREGIDSLVTPSHVETRENFTAYEKDSGEQYRFVLPGSALHRAEWEACLDKLASLPDRPKFVVASGSVPPGVPEDFFARAVRHAKALGAKTVIDTSGAALERGARRRRHADQAEPGGARRSHRRAARQRRRAHRRLPQA